MAKFLAAIGVALALGSAPVGALAYTPSSTPPTFLEMFPPEQRTCGRIGWRFPGLIRGDQPITACMLKFRGNRGSSPFGPL